MRPVLGDVLVGALVVGDILQACFAPDIRCHLDIGTQRLPHLDAVARAFFGFHREHRGNGEPMFEHVPVAAVAARADENTLVGLDEQLATVFRLGGNANHLAGTLRRLAGNETCRLGVQLP